MTEREASGLTERQRRQTERESESGNMCVLCNRIGRRGGGRGGRRWDIILHLRSTTETE